MAAVDFSLESLRINQSASGDDSTRALYVLADLKRLRVARGAVDVLMMCDFLQHLGGHSDRVAFLRNAFSWLKPGGRFYLSFFNFNVVNRWKGDKRGAFSGGAIPYERIALAEVLPTIEEYARVEKVVPMNIAQGVLLDRVLSRLPMASGFARMWSLSGRRY